MVLSSDGIKNKLLEQLKALKLFPNNNEVRILRKRIKKQLEKIRITVAEPVPTAVVPANVRRSKSLKKHFRYLRLIRNNFPNLKFGDIRKQFSKRRKGFESNIPDAVWQNPSP